MSTKPVKRQDGIRLQVTLRRVHVEALRAMAEREGSPLAAIIRRAVSDAISKQAAN
jgi:hypothetical protein